jgi:hypothetical protein
MNFIPRSWLFSRCSVRAPGLPDEGRRLVSNLFCSQVGGLTPSVRGAPTGRPSTYNKPVLWFDGPPRLAAPVTARVSCSFPVRRKRARARAALFRPCSQGRRVKRGERLARHAGARTPSPSDRSVRGLALAAGHLGRTRRCRGGTGRRRHSDPLAEKPPANMRLVRFRALEGADPVLEHERLGLPHGGERRSTRSPG